MVNGNEITTGAKTKGKFVVEYQQNGYGGCIPIIDGTPQPSLMFGYVSESDKQAAMELLEKALVATGGNISAIPGYIMNAVKVTANDVKVEDVVEVEGTELLVNYTEKKMYFNEEEIANLDDVPCELPAEAVKIMLTDRAKMELERRRTVVCPCGYDDYDDYDDDYGEDYGEDDDY